MGPIVIEYTRMTLFIVNMGEMSHADVSYVVRRTVNDMTPK